MSASLVGSEMCIRDSSPPAPITSVWAGQAVGVWLKSAARGCRRPLARTCLLYTSDAADDM
eukprot:11777594-Alexandrium_andersonii.AAC.1